MWVSDISESRFLVIARRYFPWGAALCGALLLASCGGDDEPSPTPTPSPTTSPSPSPSPTPTATPTPTSVSFDFTTAFAATFTNTAYAYAYFTPGTGGAEVWSDGTRREGQSKIAYTVSPERAEFQAADSDTVYSFAGADRVATAADRRLYRQGTESLLLARPFEHVLRVIYERSDPYVRETVPGTLRSNRVALFFNSVTTTAAISENLAYTGTAEVVGGQSGTTPAGVYSSPEATLTVAASDKKITGSIRVVENVSGTATVRAVLPISATVGSSGAFTGEIDDTANGFEGRYVGSLAGPAREEVFVLFNVRNADGRKILGSFIGNRD